MGRKTGPDSELMAGAQHTSHQAGVSLASSSKD